MAVAPAFMRKLPKINESSTELRMTPSRTQPSTTTVRNTNDSENDDHEQTKYGLTTFIVVSLFKIY